MATHFNISLTTVRSILPAAVLLGGLGSTAAAQFANFAVVATSLRGSRASIEKMYTFARRHDIDFLRTSADVDSAVVHGRLVPLAGSAFYEVSASVGFAYATPEARAFVEGLAPRFVQNCGTPLVITSATRPESRQPRNAAELSVHPAGIAVDLRRPYPGPCLSWLRDTLLTMEETGRIEVTEERRPPHFHVAVLAQPGSAPIPGLIELLASTDSAILAQPGSLNEIEHPSTPTLAFAPLFRAPLPLSGLLAAMTGELVTFEPDSPVVMESAGDIVLAPKDSGAPKPDTAKPAGRETRLTGYTVRSGDTLWDIAKQHNLSVGELQRANNLGRRSRIKPKMVLKIPR